MRAIRLVLGALLLLLPAFRLQAQKKEMKDMGSHSLLTDLIDTSTIMGKNMLSLYSRYGHLGFSGYIQPQYQWALSEGAGGNTYQGGEFGKFSDNRFRLRRGRLRTDFTHYDADGNASVYFVFQFDGSERGVNIRDFWGRYYENKWQLFHMTMGVMARPFGHEILLSSVSREAPERGRMSQILMGTERDLGITFSFNPRKSDSRWKWLGVDLGIYNGQGLTGPMEYDSHKEIVGRISSKKQQIKGTQLKISGGVSGYFGGIVNQSPYKYRMVQQKGRWAFYSDSTAANRGSIAPRRYFGADVQLVIPNRSGQSEFRAEYISGLQTGTVGSSVTPGTYPTEGSMAAPLYTREFNGAYFYYLQHIGSWKHQVILKYDWYDPNTQVAGKDIAAINGFNDADVRFHTLGAGYMYYFNTNLKTVIWYEHPMNEQVGIPGYDRDLNDGVLTIRAQFSF